MKKKLFTLILGVIISLQAVCSFNATVTAETDSISTESVVQVAGSTSANPIEIQLMEGQQVQLDFQLDPDEYYLDNVYFRADEGNVVGLHNGKLVGCCAGEDDVVFFVKNKLTNREEVFYIHVEIIQNESISDENRAELNRIKKEFPYDDFRRRKLELVGIIDEDAPRLDMEKLLEITETSSSFEEILIRLNEYHGCMDVHGGSGNTRYTYWFDSKGNEIINCILEEEFISYGKTSDDGTFVGSQMLYPEKTEFVEYDDEINYDYITYNQIPPEGDVNGDGVFNVADAVTFQKWLNGSSNTEIDTWITADFCEDDVLDSFDLCVMKNRLINGAS